ncbi:NADPH:quinone reductase [Liquorilactobacillus satsumensis]|uniref:NADPH:quinone reductase n=1 Tax=Liquorilactobacillus TaxID=2767888 RepID=UPI0021C2C6D5|nr:NADPH:quinone reductase [Liquorilactobacillus satsumensis]MCP9313753.1 NADPH:quinone reductase [Liquorilactobacillus satsumensis]MCP9360894.1 NADPH:quinone reductase [Liquorilactobacillus satsumensis]
MKAICVSKFGPAEMLKLTAIKEPEPQENEVRIKLYAAGVNPVDAYIRAGNYTDFKADLPYVPGLDGAGVIDKLGLGVTNFKVGDRVFVASFLTNRQLGTYAEKTVRNVAFVRHLPKFISFEEGATLSSPASTAYHVLFDKAKLNAGETVLIHGASGSVGLIAVQLAKNAGAKVIGTAGSTAGIAHVKHAGADLVLNHHDPTYLNKIRNVDLVLEVLANVNLIKDIKILKKFGRVIVIGNRGSLSFNPRLIISKDITLIGMSLWNVPSDQYQHNLDVIENDLFQKRFRPTLGKILPLSEAAQAHELVLNNQFKGKIVLTTNK